MPSGQLKAMGGFCMRDVTSKSRPTPNLIYMKKLWIILLSCTLFPNGFSQTITERDLKPQFEKYGVDGCFVVYDQKNNEYTRYNAALCDTGYIPASTFKIPHTLIALEEKIVRDTSEIIRWDGDEWPNKSWNMDQTLITAMENSCVWVYVRFAEQIGIDAYHRYVNAFNYGNKDLTGPPAKFWLSGLFRISANQQVDFLRNFYNYNLPVSRRSINIVKDIIIIDRSGTFTLSGKSGSGKLSNDEWIMWMVGYIEKNNKPFFYALNFKTRDFNRLSQARYVITKEILRELKLMDE